MVSAAPRAQPRSLSAEQAATWWRLSKSVEVDGRGRCSLSVASPRARTRNAPRWRRLLVAARQTGARQRPQERAGGIARSDAPTIARAAPALLPRVAARPLAVALSMWRSAA